MSDSSSKQSSGPDSDPDVTPQPEPEPTPTPNPTPTPSPTPTPNPTPTPSPTLTPSPTPTANPTPTPDPNPDMGDSGNAITASSCSLSDVKAAIDQARDGDVVIVPSGSCTWASGLSISGKGIHLKAASPGAVTLKHGGGAFSMFNITSDSTHSVRVSGFNFNDTSSTEYWNGTFVHALGSGKPILLHDNVISSPYRRVIAWRARGGVIYNNLFEGFGGTVNAIQILGESDSWSTPDTMGMRDVNGDRNLYIEDNTFKNYIAQSLDPDSHSRVVIRYNLFDHSALSSHGADTSTHGTRHWEFYNNQFIWKNHGDCDGSKTVNLAYLWYIRGGTGIIADNVFVDLNSCAWGNKPEIVFTVQNINRRAGPYACWTTYPAPHQVGQSHDGSKYITDPVYIWGNMGGGNYNNPSVSTYSPDDCGNGLKSTDFIKPNRDYITGQAKPGYSKYPYPHPLR